MFLQIPHYMAMRDSVLTTYAPLVEADALVKKKFVEPIDSNDLVDGALHGLMLTLDRYSGYIPPNELAAYSARKTGLYGGVGLELGERHGSITVIAPLTNGPADRAGILPGDCIASIKGEDATDMSVMQAMNLLLGEPGTKVTIEVHRERREEALRFELTRELVSKETVRGFTRQKNGDWNYLIERNPPIGYIRISSFSPHTMADFDRSLSEILHRNAKILILDFRFNPGGLMHQALEMIDRFVTTGPILATVTRTQAITQYSASQADTLDDLDLVVLINGYSASSAEIVSGSLQAHNRAIIIGERSFGKGSVQHLLPLTKHKAALKLTVAHYQLPNGRIIHRDAHAKSNEPWGIIPDIEVPLGPEEERILRLAWSQIDRRFSKKIPPEIQTHHNQSPENRATVPLDTQLKRALFEAKLLLTAREDRPSHSRVAKRR